MKAHAMIFSVDSIVPSDFNKSNVVCTVLRSFADKYRTRGFSPPQYQFELPNRIADNVSIDDTMKIVLYSESPLVTAEDYSNFAPVGRRVEMMRSGSDSWELLVEEMNNEVA